ncbi:MAG TPA: HAMP domain-containing sensor histidine kinase [Flavobacteriales bacterium]|nr:HAMP domain-containing histidine kinase [Flavobacteriales bacterium]MBK6549838.1 HAMP domain-containing histidine kinase [Flavobacteriales bacterium]MBK7113095.1 HAMP domain-containing histidine kinase [Flavobacteriales bacterium]MBK8533227.1 HAMP domain-containing histidine kinase [Flavobacteriales bacterium]MBK9626283.1 HAMP domain-containing histidine kinase [Flavobacteriales bacterium]
MDKRWITGWLIAISIALLGLMGIQVKWMRDTMDLREVQFQRSVDNALFAVSDRLEQLERMHVLKRHGAGRRLLGKLDATRRARSGQQDVHEHMMMHEDPDPMVPTTPPYPPVADGLERTWDPQEEEDHEALITDLVRGILASELVRDIQERIDPGVLDSLLMEEFKANGIQGPLHYGVFDGYGHPMMLNGKAWPDQALVAEAPFREKLFRHDLAGPSYFLHVDVPGQRRVLWQGMLPLLLISAVFMVIIGMAFAFTIRTIFRQKRISEIRNDLVNNLTHELKTPISTIGLACEALSDPSMPKTEEQVRTFVGMIRDENKRLGSLVENVLQSAVMESGQMVIKHVDLDVHALLQDVVRSSNIQVSRRNGRIDLDLKAEIYRVSGDRIHLTNLFYNLIDNAVKYAEQEPRIRIATTSNNEGVTVSVSDNGIGIAPSEQRKVFERLYRVPTGNIHNAKGFGLGLSYVRTVVDRHEGRIELDSVPGRGSTFRIFIPFEHVRTTEAAIGRRRQQPR